MSKLTGATERLGEAEYLGEEQNTKDVYTVLNALERHRDALYELVECDITLLHRDHPLIIAAEAVLKEWEP